VVLWAFFVVFVWVPPLWLTIVIGVIAGINLEKIERALFKAGSMRGE